MVLESVLGFLISCIILVKSSTYAVRSLAAIARILHIKEFVISFVIIGIISSLPEGMVAILSALEDDPAIGFGALIGSNIADLSIVLGLIVLIGGTLRVRSTFIHQEILHVVFILLPFILAYDGILSRFDGLILLAVCLGYIVHLVRRRYRFAELRRRVRGHQLAKNVWIFLLSIGVLILSAWFVVLFTEKLSVSFAIPTVILALVLIGLGTCLPELIFAIRSIRLRHDEFALGDILGNVVVDATLMLGVTAVLSPIYLNKHLILVTGAFTVLLVLMVLAMLRYKKEFSKNDAVLMIFVYIIFIIVEMIMSKIM